MSLELYAKVEHLLGIEESTDFLHDGYMELLEHHEIGKLLDIGCGRGKFIKALGVNGVECKGIDLSQTMITDALKDGLNVECIDIADVKEKYDVVTAVFDVLNFLDNEQLHKFLEDVSNVLDDDGVFLADVNTLHGFKNVAEGVLSVDEGSTFFNVEAIYDQDKLNTTFTLFSESENGCFTKEQGTITQHFHQVKTLKSSKHLKLVEKRFINLYDKKDKLLLVFKKV
ncbi:MAG: methyltransferase domain-containing protein [Helicobacteraceae bacterium]|nr:methyltransferase domain-containing protein [Helicobacteraceae bacterium]